MSFVICIDNSGYEASLEKRKVYEVPEKQSGPTGFIAIIDESGEEYYFEKDRFLPIELTNEIISYLAS